MLIGKNAAAASSPAKDRDHRVRLAATRWHAQPTQPCAHAWWVPSSGFGGWLVAAGMLPARARPARPVAR
jgi:hypothetical protein